MNLKDAFAGMRDEPEPKPTAMVKRSRPELVKPVVVQEPAERRLGRSGKSTDPSFERVTVYVRSDTRKQAWRQWEDETGAGDFSDLVQDLLRRYLNGEV